MQRPLFWIVVIIVFACFPSVSTAAPTSKELLNAINTARQERGVRQLKDSYTLRRAAVGRADDMARFGYFSHTSLSGRTYRWWLATTPVHFSKTGENIARGQKSTGIVILGWEGSGSHRKNLLDPSFTHVGTAVRKIRWQGATTYLYVAVFGRYSSQ